MAHRVLAVGDVNVDLLFTGLSRIPGSEQEIIAHEFEAVVGGQTGTISRALSSLGASVTFVGRVGDDAYGQKAIETLKEAGVDTLGVTVDPELKTGVTVVLSTGTERAFATYLGSISEVRRSDVNHALLQDADHIHIGSYYLQAKLRHELDDLFKEARTLGLTTSLDPGWDPSEKWGKEILDLLKRVDVFLPNEVEALHITQMDAPEKALQLLGEEAGTVVIKRGDKGCLARNQVSTVHCPAYEVPVVDVTSAGDVFNAGFIFAFLNGWKLDTAARFASACGAIAVTKAGSFGIISSVQEVEDFIASKQHRSELHALN